MGAAERPVPEDGVMSAEEQASYLVATGPGVTVENEAEELAKEWGAPVDGVYAPNAEARELFGEGETA